MRLVPHIEKDIARCHTYEVPEIASWPLERGSQDYFTWLDAFLVSDD